ncbi:MAG TPA: hypothetical protein VJM84_05760 [Actinomycetota bacterium]|nr:hypothetical protein [Actinomycetota bacterium]
MTRTAATLSVLLVLPMLVAATDPRGDLVACDGSGAFASGAADLLGVDAVAAELGSVALWRLRFAEPPPGGGDRSAALHITVYVRDPRIPGQVVDGHPGVNRTVSWSGGPDDPVQIRLVPEDSTTPFNPPVIDGDTVEIQVPGRILVGEEEDGTADVGGIRWSIVVRQGDACDGFGGGKPTLRLRGLGSTPATSARPGTRTPVATASAGASPISGGGRAMLTAAVLVLVCGAIVWVVRRRRRL